VPAVGKVFATKTTLPLLVVDGESVGEYLKVEALNADVGESIQMQLFEFDFVFFQHFLLIGSDKALLLHFEIGVVEKLVVPAVALFFHQLDSGVGVVEFAVQSGGVGALPLGKDDILFDLCGKDAFVFEDLGGVAGSGKMDFGVPFFDLFEEFVVQRVPLVPPSKFVVDGDGLVLLAPVFFQEGEVVVCEAALGEPWIAVFEVGAEVVSQSKNGEFPVVQFHVAIDEMLDPIKVRRNRGAIFDVRLELVDEFALERADFEGEEGDVKANEGAVLVVAQSLLTHFGRARCGVAENGVFGPKEPFYDVFETGDLFCGDGDHWSSIPQEGKSVGVENGGLLKEGGIVLLGVQEARGEGGNELVPVGTVNTLICVWNAKISAAFLSGKFGEQGFALFESFVVADEHGDALFRVQFGA